MNSALQLLITLAGVTLLFGCAQANGTMEAAARQALRVCRGHAVLLPPAFFLLAAILAMVGPGAILSTALVAPFAMSTGVRAGVPPFLIALMAGNGANAGNLSPFSTVGVIVTELMARAGLGGHEFRVWFFHGAAHIAVALFAYVCFGGLKLFRQSRTAGPPVQPPLERRQILTLAVTGLWIVSVIGLRWPLGWSAFGAASVLLLLRLATLKEAVRRMPWKIIALVVSISTAVSFLERAGGLNWFQDLFARLATVQSVHAVIAFLTGVISAYSSTSGVVLPAFLPLAPGLAERLPGVDPLALSISINIGSALVDVSPLSTLGALCIAAAPKGVDTRLLFRNLMLWGLSMSVTGAAICYFASPLFAP
ncbi:MAG: SLC13 family permease [Bryobacteraceae bacterium]